MTNYEPDVRVLAENELFRAGYDAERSRDLAHRWAEEGGAATATNGATGYPLLHCPSGGNLRDWTDRLKESGTAPHLFSPPATPTPVTAKAKTPIDKGLSADERLSLANGHAPFRRPAGKA